MSQMYLSRMHSHCHCRWNAIRSRRDPTLEKAHHSRRDPTLEKAHHFRHDEMLQKANESRRRGEMLRKAHH